MREKVKQSDKVPIPGNPVIEPVVFHITDSAVTYGVDWAGTVKIDGQVGWWRSTQGSRGHGNEWKELLDARVSSGSLSSERWTGKSYFFSQQEGEEALEMFLQGVLEGRIKTRRDVWQNYAGRTGVPYEELRDRYPQVYRGPGSVRTQKEPEVQDADKELETSTPITDMYSSADRNHIVEETHYSEDDIPEPSDEEIRKMEEEDTLVAATALEEPLSTQYETLEDDGSVVITIDGHLEHERFGEDVAIVRHDEDNRDHKHYNVFIPKLERTMLLEAGDWVINGLSISIEVR